MALTLKDIHPGDEIEIECPKLLNNIKHKSRIIGVVESVFDTLFPDGSEGNLELEVRWGPGYWLKYKQSSDGGTVTIIRKREENEGT